MTGMIGLRGICKSFGTANGRKVIARDISASFPARTTVALLGRNGVGKSSLLQMIAGNLPPDRGEVLHHGTVSFPVGFKGSFHRDLTGAQNVRFVARVYGVDTDDLLEFVAVCDIGDHMHMPVRSYSTGMRSRLAFGVSMGIHFDTYLVDEITAVGDQDFRKKSRAVFEDRMAQSGAIVISHGLKEIRTLCSSGAVLESGALHYFNDVEDAIAFHKDNIARASSKS